MMITFSDRNTKWNIDHVQNHNPKPHLNQNSKHSPNYNSNPKSLCQPNPKMISLILVLKQNKKALRVKLIIALMLSSNQYV